MNERVVQKFEARFGAPSRRTLGWQTGDSSSRNNSTDGQSVGMARASGDRDVRIAGSQIKHRIGTDDFQRYGRMRGAPLRQPRHQPTAGKGIWGW